MNDGSLTTFAELPDLLEHTPLSSRTSQGCYPQATGTLWPESVRRWPSTVSTDGDGRLYEHPTFTSAPPTDENDGSALLGTPTAHERTHSPRQVHHGIQLANQVADLLPTPTTRETKGSDAAGREGGPSLGPGMEKGLFFRHLPPASQAEPPNSIWNGNGEAS